MNLPSRDSIEGRIARRLLIEGVPAAARIGALEAEDTHKPIIKTEVLRKDAVEAIAIDETALLDAFKEDQ